MGYDRRPSPAKMRLWEEAMPLTPENSIYQLKLTLRYVKPPIWRRVQVSKETTLPQLHEIIQVAMGWSNYHMHEFIIHKQSYGKPEPNLELYGRNEAGIRLDQIFSSEKQRFTYQYDFGDGWMHEILFERALKPEKGTRYPLCVAGARRCPREDCGGASGYMTILYAANHPDEPLDPEDQERVEWFGGFDPDYFNLEGINDGLRALRRRK
jgi:hypothetical protein